MHITDFARYAYGTYHGLHTYIHISIYQAGHIAAWHGLYVIASVAVVVLFINFVVNLGIWSVIGQKWSKIRGKDENATKCNEEKSVGGEAKEGESTDRVQGP